MIFLNFQPYFCHLPVPIPSNSDSTLNRGSDCGGGGTDGGKAEVDIGI